MEGALAQLGLGPAMRPYESLSVVTGMEAVPRRPTKDTRDLSDKFDQDGLWDLVNKGATTPVVFQSLEQGARSVASKHAWAVLGGEERDGVRM